MYVTSPEPSNFSGILDQFTLDVSYNTWDNSKILLLILLWNALGKYRLDVSSNVNPMNIQ